MKGRRIVWPEVGRAELETFEFPVLPPDGVLIETEYSVLSAGTEKAFLQGRPNTADGRFPQYPGYSATGRVLDVGKDVTGFSPGDRVVAYHSGHASHAIKPAQKFARIEDAHIALDEAAFTIIAAMSLQGIRKARLELGESVAVMGMGLLGLFATQLARLDGALPVIALDPADARRELALELGADHALSPMHDQFPETFRALTHGEGANAVIEVTGITSAMHQALACVAPIGRVVALGCSREKADGIDFYQDVHRTGVSIIGAHNFVRPAYESSPGYWTMQDDVRVLLRTLAAHRLSVRPMISEHVDPELAPAVYQRLLDDPCPPLGVVFAWSEGGGKP